MIRTVRSALTAVPPQAWLVAALVSVPFVVALATYRGVLIPAAAAAAGLLGVVLTMSRPLPMLLLYVALIPVEAIVVVGPGATLARLVGVVFFGGYLLRRIGQIRLDAMPVAGWAFLAWAATSALWAIDPLLTVTQFITLIQLALIAVVIADLISEQPDSIQPILWAYTGSALVVAATGIADYVLASGFGTARASAFEAQGPAHLAAVLLPAFVHLSFEFVKRQQRTAVGIALLVVVAAILLSGTRSAWLAVAVTVLIGIVPRVSMRALVPALLLGLALLAVLQVPEVGALYASRIATAAETGGAGRVDIWSVGLWIIGRNPILGVGLDNFPAAFTLEAIRAAEVPGLNLGILVPGTAPHSIVISTFAELGAVGLVLLAGFIVSIFRRPAYGGSSFPIKIMLAGLLVQALFLDLLARKQVWLVIALILGLGMAEVRERRRQHEDERAEHRRFAERIRGTWGAAP